MMSTTEPQTRNPLRPSPLDARLYATHETFLAERPAGADEDVHMFAAAVDHVIERCSGPGDTVFDPFAGFGTTLQRAVALGRQAIGIELLPERVAYIQDLVPAARVVEGDARELSRLLHRELSAPPEEHIDLILTSPPYMTASDHEADPLTAYERDGGDYSRYLAELGLVAAQCARTVAPGGYVVWNVADIHHEGRTTPLIADCARVLGRHLTPCAPTEIVWDRYPHDLTADALLVFRRETSLPVHP
ncbi:MAG: DNA methyltransferase [Leucobacter sp.]